MRGTLFALPLDLLPIAWVATRNLVLNMSTSYLASQGLDLAAGPQQRIRESEPVAKEAIAQALRVDDATLIRLVARRFTSCSRRFVSLRVRSAEVGHCWILLVVLEFRARRHGRSVLGRSVPEEESADQGPGAP